MRIKILLAALVVCLSAPAAHAQIPAFKHVFVIVFENHEYGEIIGNPAAPYFNRLASENALATSAFAVAHPSLLNYMALTGGDTFFTSNCIGCTTPAANIADRIEAAGRSWTGYMEDLPGTCGATDSGLYVARHNPFVHYASIATNPSRCGRVVPFTRFSSDLAAKTLADYVWITPNLCNDMHDCSIATGDAWLRQHIAPLVSIPRTVVFVVVDEGTSSRGGGGRVVALALGPVIRPGTHFSAPTTHYGLLRTIETALQVPLLGASRTATPITGIWR
jgi:acid phosphatase